jgi:hypothetical protein
MPTKVFLYEGGLAQALKVRSTILGRPSKKASILLYTSSSDKCRCSILHRLAVSVRNLRFRGIEALTHV